MSNKNNNLIGISGKMGSGKDLVYHIINYLKQEDDWKSFKDYMSNSFFVHNIHENKKFAGKIKDIVCLLIGCTKEQLEDRVFKEKELGEEWWYYCNSLFFDGETKIVSYSEANDNIKNNTSWYIVKLTPRKLLQLLGTEAGRQIIHPNIWVNALFADYVCNDCGQKECPTDEYSFPNWIITDVRFPNEVLAIKNRGGIVIRVNRDYQNSLMPEIAVTEHPSETSLDNYYFQYVVENDGSIEDLVEKVRELKLI